MNNHNEKPKISVIIPVYNVEEYLRECLDSIVKQQFKDYEAILIDDGSTDNSPAICDDYVEKYPQLSVIHKENGGVSSARNVGLDVAKGGWIWFVDADDWIKEKSLELLNDVVSSNNCDLVFHGLIHVYEDGREEEERHNSDLVSEKEVFLLNNYCYQNGMLLFKADIINKHHLRYTEGIKMGEDLVFQYKYLTLCKFPIQIEYNLYYYRRREGSAIANEHSKKNNMYDNMRNAHEMLDFIENNHIKMINWLAFRIHRLVKASIQSAVFVDKGERKTIDAGLKHYIHRWKCIDSYFSLPKAIVLASISMPLYIFLYNRIIKVKQ